MFMRVQVVFTALLALSAIACNRASDRREFTLQGQVLSIDPAKKYVTVKHE